MFLTFLISLIKGVNINDSELLDMWTYALNFKSKWFYIKSSFESALRKPTKAACGLSK